MRNWPATTVTTTIPTTAEAVLFSDDNFSDVSRVKREQHAVTDCDYAHRHLAAVLACPTLISILQ